MGRYRVGLVGARRGSGLVSPFQVFPETQITALCDLDPERLADAGAVFKVPDSALFTDYAAFLNGPVDVVVVATPMPAHVAQTVQALEAGKDVLSEVTAADRLEDCERLVQAVRRTGRTYMMGENSCYSHFIHQWKQWVDAGRLGQIFYAEGEYVHEIQELLWDAKTGRKHWRAERPPIHYCTHSLGPLLMIMSDRIVAACGADAGYGVVPALGKGCLNMEVALFRTQKGALIKLLRSQVAYREPGMHYYSLYGTKGFVESGRGGWGREELGKLYVEGEMMREHGFEAIECPAADPSAPKEAFSGGHGTSEYYMIRDFIDALVNRRKPPIDVIRAMDFTVPGLCAQKSIESGGGWVDVPQFSW